MVCWCLAPGSVLRGRRFPYVRCPRRKSKLYLKVVLMFTRCICVLFYIAILHSALVQFFFHYSIAVLCSVLACYAQFCFYFNSFVVYPVLLLLYSFMFSFIFLIMFIFSFLAKTASHIGSVTSYFSSKNEKLNKKLHPPPVLKDVAVFFLHCYPA